MCLSAQEDPKHTLYFAHLFFADHILSSAWLVFFAVLWWFYVPHDGTVQIHSDAQKAVQESGPGHNMTAEERATAAMTIWNAEKGIATAMIVMGWIVKVCIHSTFCFVPVLTHVAMCDRYISRLCCIHTPFTCARARTDRCLIPVHILQTAPPMVAPTRRQPFPTRTTRTLKNSIASPCVRPPPSRSRHRTAAPAAGTPRPPRSRASLTS